MFGLCSFHSPVWSVFPRSLSCPDPIHPSRLACLWECSPTSAGSRASSFFPSPTSPSAVTLTVPHYHLCRHLSPSGTQGRARSSLLSQPCFPDPDDLSALRAGPSLARPPWSRWPSDLARSPVWAASKPLPAGPGGWGGGVCRGAESDVILGTPWAQRALGPKACLDGWAGCDRIQALGCPREWGRGRPRQTRLDRGRR